MPKKRLDLFPYVLIAPAVFAATLVVLIPILQTAGMSFMNYLIYKPKARSFIGLKNYITALADPVFWISIRHTVVWIAGVISLQLALGFGAALLLNRNFWWRGIARSLILIPWVTPSVITALMWRWMYDGNRGVINDLLVRFGFLRHYFPWLSNDKTALVSVMVALMWQGFPFFTIMIMAGLQSIPSSLYEAAMVDGAGAVTRFVKITVPLLIPILFTTILLRIIWVANSLDIIFVMTGGGPGYSTYTLPLYSYVKAYKALDFGYAATLALLLAALLAVVVAGYVAKVLSTEDSQ
ncbi:MAG: sugar ABC transporter permease [Treponema sp. GWB1_62_6]|nr:MAG: sugar ABC transporter permease [Treponema sp. GWC1_61_84]OHE70249.1 MAG: sugar ABC transporter permease [Treponema sp. GWB1_62_6]OHE75870.1 MAG: sugar ABC transporter permease [Treponema sp. RIFOXYC1_FULL_61_9]HCM26393.1 sugar ABC transporter permease [Treponema sp.]